MSNAIFFNGTEKNKIAIMSKVIESHVVFDFEIGLAIIGLSDATLK